MGNHRLRFAGPFLLSGSQFCRAANQSNKGSEMTKHETPLTGFRRSTVSTNEHKDLESILLCAALNSNADAAARMHPKVRFQLKSGHPNPRVECPLMVLIGHRGVQRSTALRRGVAIGRCARQAVGAQTVKARLPLPNSKLVAPNHLKSRRMTDKTAPGRRWLPCVTCIGSL
jgi:hypothetical protein